jgi:hypothetical protein
MNKPLLPGVDRGLCAVSKMQFTQDVADMSFGGSHGDDQLIRNLLIRVTLRN